MFGPVASTPTAWRLQAGIDTTTLTALRTARAAAREVAWLQAARAPGRDTGFTGRGRELSGLVLDNPGEALAGLLRAGNAGANTAAGHITVLDAALAQLPDPHRHGTDLLIRTDSAGAAKAFLHHIRALRERGIHAFFSVGYPVTEPVRRTIRALPETPASHLNHDTAPARPQPEEPGAPDPRVGPRPCPSTRSNQTHHRTPAQTGSATRSETGRLEPKPGQRNGPARVARVRRLTVRQGGGQEPHNSQSLTSKRLDGQ